MWLYANKPDRMEVIPTQFTVENAKVETFRHPEATMNDERCPKVEKYWNWPRKLNGSL